MPASQILRLLQTVNSKSGERVRVLHVEDGLPLYCFDKLADHVLPFTRQQIRRFREAKALGKGAARLVAVQRNAQA